MYAWINGESWAGDAQPALTDQHGYLCDPLSGVAYGRLLTDAEDDIVARALVAWHGMPELPLNVD
jgi:hypothetical protein